MYAAVAKQFVRIMVVNQACINSSVYFYPVSIYHGLRSLDLFTIYLDKYQCTGPCISVQVRISVCRSIYQCAGPYISVQVRISVCRSVYQCAGPYICYEQSLISSLSDLAAEKTQLTTASINCVTKLIVKDSLAIKVIVDGCFNKNVKGKLITDKKTIKDG